MRKSDVACVMAAWKFIVYIQLFVTSYAAVQVLGLLSIEVVCGYIFCILIEG